MNSLLKFFRGKDGGKNLMENKMPIDKKELLELLKEHLVILIQDKEFASYYDQKGCVKFTVSLNWRDDTELIKISRDSFSIDR